MLTNNNIRLRKILSTDVDAILEWENNPDNWEVSGTSIPYTKNEIVEFVNGEHDIIKNKQIRYIIELIGTNKAIGTIDLFEYDAQRNQVGIGILIADLKNRRKGYAKEALTIIIDHCRNELQIVNVFCNISKDNEASIRLFEKCGFEFVEARILYNNDVNYYELT